MSIKKQNTNLISSKLDIKAEDHNSPNNDERLLDDQMSNCAERASLSRRLFLTGIAAGAGLLALGGATARVDAQNGGNEDDDVHEERGKYKKLRSLPEPEESGIEHIVLVMMENRSFDHFLGWLPGANGRQAGLTYYDKLGIPHSTYPLFPDYQGCSHPDPDHSYSGARVEYNNGACDGWLRAGNNDVYSIGYYTQSDLPFLGQAAPYWTTLDTYFAATLGPTFPNRFYQHSAQTDRISNTPQLSTLPTIWDRLAQKGLTGRYYFSNLPFLGLWGAKYASITRPFAEFIANCAAGTLPQVSFVDPSFTADPLEGNDDHPHDDIRNGESFLDQIYTAVTSSPNWPNTVLVINFDEWGGFFDHMPPAIAPDVNPATALRGFRVPCLVISPWSVRGLVSSKISSHVYDHTSVLKMIEWRWRLKPLTIRDATAHNIAELLNFRRPDFLAHPYAVAPGPYGIPCPGNSDVITP